MPDDPKPTPDPAPATPAVPEEKAAAEKTYTEAEKNAAIEAAVKDRFKHVPDKDALKVLQDKAKKADELEAAQRTELENEKLAREAAEKRASDAEEKAAKAELDSLKSTIGAELNIPASLRSRLAGSTEEEVRADAMSVAAELKIEPPPVPVGGGGRPVTDQPDVTLAQKRAAAGLKD
jgi:hypothetical protein